MRPAHVGTGVARCPITDHLSYVYRGDSSRARMLVAGGALMIRKWLTPAVAVVLAVASMTGFVLLQHRAEGFRRAQVTLANVKSQFTLVGVDPLQLVDGLATPAAVTASMAAGQRSVISDLDGLLHSWPTPALPRIVGPVRTDFAAVDQIRRLLIRDPSLGDPTNILLAVHLGESANQSGDAATAMINEATNEYQARASSAETQSLVGGLLALAALLTVFLVFYWRWQRLLVATHRDAHTDALTGLGNRRALIEDLSGLIAEADDSQPLVVNIYDLDGFKGYNDTFGHLAGDALLARFAGRLAATVSDVGTAYRMGGDEFCCVARLDREQIDWQQARGTHALREAGEAFEIGCSAGSVVIPDEADSADTALQLADQRMYEHKSAGSIATGRESADVLLEVLREKDTTLREHTSEVAELAEATAEELGMAASEVQYVRLAAELHDIGKSAIPETILNKPDALSAEEWDFIRNHTLIGERIIRVAPSLAPVAGLVRASHERVDGGGYPDGLVGDAIPVGSRIVAICDAFDAMVSKRPYREPRTVPEALVELRRCAGTQFDPQIVETVCGLIAQRHDIGIVAA